MSGGRAALIWAALAIAVITPLAFAVTTPLLAYRDPAYIVAGVAGVVALALLLVQPLLAGGYLPPLHGIKGRRIHAIVGGVLVCAVVVHVAGLWITSPPDVIDALLFNSPTSFSIWGVIAMWAVFATALLAMLRRRGQLRLLTWRRGHGALALVIGLCTAAHAMLIEGTMETVTKAMLCALAFAAAMKVVIDLRLFAKPVRPEAKTGLPDDAKP